MVRTLLNQALRVVLPAILLGMACIAGCDRQQAMAGPTKMPPALVTVTPAALIDAPVYLDEIGKCSALEAVTVTPQVAGIITKREFEDGADIKKGQPLFTIDPRPFKASLDSAEAQLAQANAALQFANLELERYTSVANTKAISKSDWDTKKNAVDVANAQVAAAEAAKETAKLNLGYCSIVSPIDGRAGARLVDVGNVVKANETALLSIQRIDPIYADFTITERELTEVQKEMAKGVLKTKVRLPIDGQDQARTGDLIFLDNAVQDGSGTVRVRAQLANSDHHFWPGQFVNVRLVLQIKPSVLVPTIATQISQQGLFVYKVVSDDKSPTKLAVMQQPVTLGQRQGDQVVIESGLSAGDRVVVLGQMMLQPGSAITVKNDKPAASPGTQPATGSTATTAPSAGGHS